MSARLGVVVPCKDEERTLARCLESLRRQDPTVDEIVVVDNGSTDASRSIAEDLADRVVTLPGVSISRLRNHGASLLGAATRADDMIGFVDADCEVGPGWAAAAIKALADADLVGSRTDASPNASWVAARWAAIERRRSRPGALVWSQHLVLRRETWEQLGGFDETLRTGEDSDLSLRIQRDGGRVNLSDDMKVVHHGFPATLRRFVRRELWHTSSPGWLERMSRTSRSLVWAGAGWAALGGCASALSLTGRSRPLVGWLMTSTIAVPVLGWSAGRSWRHCLQDGVLVTLWNLVRVGRLLAPAPAIGRWTP